MLLIPSYNSKTRGERPKWISDSDFTLKNKTNQTKLTSQKPILTDEGD